MQISINDLKKKISFFYIPLRICHEIMKTSWYFPLITKPTKGSVSRQLPLLAFQLNYFVRDKFHFLLKWIIKCCI